MALQAAPAVRAPVVTGDAQVGATLTAAVATPAAKGTKYLFKWQTQKKVTVKKKAVIKWVAISGAGKAIFVPPAGLRGAKVRACVKAKGAASAWKCSGAKVVSAALSGTSPSGATPAPAAPAPAAPAPAAPALPDPLSINYFTQRFVTGSASTLLPAIITGGSGAKRFQVSAGTLPDGVTFDQGTGTFTGPGASAWNFRATQVTAGYFHTCALTTSGGVKCWGAGGNGRLGNGALLDKSTPVDVVATGGSGTLSGITQITAGNSHTCALTTSGGVKCWGSGGDGQLGNGALLDKSTPVDVVATGGSGTLSGITQITAGGSHTCALTTSGGVKCWGYGFYGQLGNGATSGQSTPVNVVDTGGSGTLLGITQITAGGFHTCALTTSGGVKCWGNGSDGRLGNGATSTQSTPVDVTGSGAQTGFPAALTVTATDDTGSTNTSVNLTEVSTPWFSYPNALFTMGQDQQQLAPVVQGGSGTKGFSVSGTLPDGVTFDQGSGTFTGPGASAWNFRATQITAGGANTCALTTSGGVKCWGSGGDGQLGNGLTSAQSTPVDVVATGGSGTLSGITQIPAGGSHTCALTTSGGVKCWGYGSNGQLGNGALLDKSTPVDVTKSGEQPGFPAALTVTVTDDTGSWTLGGVILGTK